jgi:hypothetical protein
MTTYADPTRCPDCRAVLPHDPQVCRVCALPLTGDTAISLFTTLQEADRLLGVLRAQKRPEPATVGSHRPAGSMLEGVAPYPAGGSGPLKHARLRGASVPKILLSLGALCLLVAAVTFLAVAWSWLGVGGRTVVLVVLTGATLGFAVGLHRRGLRMAAESLAVVGLGLLALDVVGVRHAGWLGQVGDAHLTSFAGVVVATGALILLVATANRPLVAPALVSPVAVLAAGAAAQRNVDSPLPTLMTVIVLLGLTRVGTTLPSEPLQITSFSTAALGWLALVAGAVKLAGVPITVAHYAGDLAAWPFLAATVTAAAVGPVTGVRRAALPGYAVAALVGSYALVLPVLDNARTAAVAALVVVAVAWVVVTVLAPRSLRAPALVPLAGTLVLPAVAVAELVGDAGHAVLSVGAPFSRTFGLHVAEVHAWASPLLLVPSALTLAAAGCAAYQLVEPVSRSRWVLTFGGAAGCSAVLTLSLYDVPLAVVVGAIVAAAVGCFVTAERLNRPQADVARTVVLVLISAAALLALPSDRMVTGVLAVACVMAGYVMTRSNLAGSAAAFCFPIAFAGLVWAGGNVLGVDEQFRALPVLLVLGGLAIWRPQLELESSSALVGTWVSAASVLVAGDLLVSLAVHLTVAGALVTTTSIVHPSRRTLAWPGALLLAAATWVRLFDLGVQVPEAYTLPSALVLVAVATWRLRADDQSATLPVLIPGLALATVPSLIATLDDPYSLRALLLGAACVAFTMAGVALRWSAPLVVGTAVGALLVVRELAPYAAQVPTWLTIGLSGALLLSIGITWESRMNDARRASRYLAALR